MKRYVPSPEHLVDDSEPYVPTNPCPNCGKGLNLWRNSTFEGVPIPNGYSCWSCGYHRPLLPGETTDPLPS